MNDHLVRFEPVGIEIKVSEDQNVLRAAAEQGVMLMHGCKEGQCAACKSFVLEGEDIEHEKYSTFALPDYEKEEGFTLLCRAHVYEDVTIELLNYDEEMIRSGLPIRTAPVTVAAIEPLTHDIRRLALRLDDADTDLTFFPGQYVDVSVPGTEETRSFSMANTSSRDGGLLELIIKIYPDGLFSNLLATKLQVGDHLEVTGPFGVFTLRESRNGDVVMIGGGAGMAPVLSLLRSMQERGMERPTTYYYGARTRADLFLEDELRALESTLPGFRYVPALSEPAPDDDWSGEVGMITDVLRRHEKDLSAVDAYVCGPPPMVDAALAVLGQLGCDDKHVYFDRFTTTADPETTPTATPEGSMS
ncbi:MAG: 2Fe-2S iron-sulfur cluster binding domain-containing protein [Nocardioidaceae bacterium]|nr:2Fe-2S iron-sulfur cluster binding domain-containing protein [Nocardioidaceae bacterium]